MKEHHVLVERRAALWKRLDDLGLPEISMAEQVRAHRALANAHGGPLSVRKSAEAPVVEALGDVLVRLLTDRGVLPEPATAPGAS